MDITHTRDEWERMDFYADQDSPLRQAIRFGFETYPELEWVYLDDPMTLYIPPGPALERYRALHSFT
jgi:hypothetical protein